MFSCRSCKSRNIRFIFGSDDTYTCNSCGYCGVERKGKFKHYTDFDQNKPPSDCKDLKVYTINDLRRSGDKDYYRKKYLEWLREQRKNDKQMVHNIKQKINRTKNREKFLEYNREYQRKNKDKIRKWSRRYQKRRQRLKKKLSQQP